MKKWKIERITTFDDQTLADFIEKIDNVPGQEVREVIYMGNNLEEVRIYQVIYTIE